MLAGLLGEAKRPALKSLAPLWGSGLSVREREVVFFDRGALVCVGGLGGWVRGGGGGVCSVCVCV